MRLAGGIKRPAWRYLGLTAVLLAAAFAMAMTQKTMAAAQKSRASALRTLAQALSLTDLCIATEARYTRHPAVTELTVAFQDHPGSLEHFPSGSFWAAQAVMRK